MNLSSGCVSGQLKEHEIEGAILKALRPICFSANQLRLCYITMILYKSAT